MATDFNINSLTDAAGAALAQTVSAALAPKLDSILKQSRAEVAKIANKPAAQVTDLEIARYMSNLPTADISENLAKQIDLTTKVLRNALLIGFGTVAVAIVVGNIVRK